jgi:hypothetical protein
MDEFVDSFIEWLEQHGYETCAIWELMDDETESNVLLPIVEGFDF